MQILNNKIDGSGSNANVLPAIEWNQLPSEVQNVITELGITLSNGDLNQLGKAIAGYVANGSFYTDSGIANAYALTPIGGKQALPKYDDGSRAEFIATSSNTGAATVNVAGLGVKNIKLKDGSDPAIGAIDGRTIIKFDDANDWFELQVELTESVGWVGWFPLDEAFYTGISTSVSAELSIPGGIFFRPDGAKMYILGTNSATVHQYTLSPAWDLSTASYDSVSFDISIAGENSIQAIFFKSDGVKMYTVGATNDSVYQFTLSTAWDLSTASYDSVLLDVTPEDGAPEGLFFRPDGVKMYMLGTSTDSVYQYTLATAWDLSTASYDSVSFDVAPEGSLPQNLSFSSDGDRMYVLSSGVVYQYTLSTAWDLSTASYDSVSFDVSAEDSNSAGLFFRPDGVKMYMGGSSSDRIHQYSTGKPYQIN